MRQFRTVSACLLSVVLVGACGGQDETSEPTATGAVTQTTTTTVGVAGGPDVGGPDAGGPDAEGPDVGGVVLDVQIAEGVVQPTNIRLDAKVGEPIVLRVTSDAVDELHVHSVPEHTFPVEPSGGAGADPAAVQEFEFVVDVPGQAAIELHDAGVTVATLLVRP